MTHPFEQEPKEELTSQQTSELEEFLRQHEKPQAPRPIPPIERGPWFIVDEADLQVGGPYNKKLDAEMALAITMAEFQHKSLYIKSGRPL
jgi:hypothetical protein